MTTMLETLRESAPKRATGGFITRCQLYIDGGLKKKFSIVHDLIDDITYDKHIKNQEKVSKTPELETIKEEASN